MTVPRWAVAALAAVVAGAGGVAAAQDPPSADGAGAPVIRERVGKSVQGRPIELVRMGDPAAPRKVLVVGCIHGNECAARAVVDDLLGGRTVPPRTQLLLIRNANPDGLRRGTRQNARGVDLNRNSSAGWQHLSGATFSGPRPFSEPETRALRDVLLRERPALVVWYHQPLRLVDAPESGDTAPARRYAAIVGLPFRPLTKYPGSMSRWTNARVRPGSSFVVELPAGRLSSQSARRHADAVLALAGGGAGAR